MADAVDCNEWDRTARTLYFVAASGGVKKKGGGEFTERELHPHSKPSKPIKLSPTDGVLILAGLPPTGK